MLYGMRALTSIAQRPAMLVVACLCSSFSLHAPFLFPFSSSFLKKRLPSIFSWFSFYVKGRMKPRDLSNVKQASEQGVRDLFGLCYIMHARGIGAVSTAAAAARQWK